VEQHPGGGDPSLAPIMAAKALSEACEGLPQDLNRGLAALSGVDASMREAIGFRAVGDLRLSTEPIASHMRSMRADDFSVQLRFGTRPFSGR
jgi:hypothetical protein